MSVLAGSYYVLLTFLVGRFFLTPNDFKNARWSLGRWSRPLTLIALIWNLYLAAVMFSPIEFPVTAETFNCKSESTLLEHTNNVQDSCVIFGAVTIFALITWWFTPEDQWLPSARLGKVHQLEAEFESDR